MRASHRWLRELCGVEADPEQVAAWLTSAGLEVETIEAFGAGLEGVVIAEVRAIRPHPARERLRLVTVFDGLAEQEVVCGAPNVPAPGGRILFARLGTRLPGGLEIAEREIGGISSSGMICSELELEIGADSGGIFVYEGRAPAEPLAAPGTPVVEALGLIDHVFELGLTPNRPDCLGHLGLAREVALAAGVRFEPPEVAIGAAGAPLSLEDARISIAAEAPGAAEARARLGAPAGALEISVEVQDAERCPRYGAALVFGVRVAPSPFWVRYRLHCLGVRPISNIVDATNLVLLEQGHPIHAFDLARLRGRRIVVRAAEADERMTTLDAEERLLSADDLLICDAEGPVALAGVMGGANSEIHAQTQDVLIECAYFDPRAVRRSARRLGLHTDASHRFERGVDRGGVPRVLARAAGLVQQLAGGVVHGDAIDRVATPMEPARISLRPARVSALLGDEVEPAQIRRILEGLGVELEPEEGEALWALAPSWRPDLQREVDLIEEIARVRGYDRIPSRIPRVRPSEQGTSRSILLERRLREAAAAAGLHEAITYGFVSAQDLERARVPREAVRLLNPLSEERSVMRTSLLPGLAAAARGAQRRQAERIELFELAHTYHPGGTLPEERAMLGMLLLGERDRWIGERATFDFYDLKGALEAVLLGALGLAPRLRAGEELDQQAPFLHPRRRAEILLADAALGVLGELHPDVVEALGLEGRPLYAELRLASLEEAGERVGLRQAPSLPRHPAVTRDMALIVSDGHAAGALSEAMLGMPGGLVEAVDIFDLYRGDPVPEGHRSLAYRIRYRAAERTLTDAEVEAAHAEIAALLEARFGALVR